MMVSTRIRSRTARCFGALIGAVALAAALPATASADHRDGRGWRGERHYDHGRRGHGDQHWRGYWTGHPVRFRSGYRYAYAPHRHGPTCSHRGAYLRYPAFHAGWYFGR